MAERQIYAPWRHQWSTTKYPFGDNATLINNEGYVLLEGTFLDAALYPVGGGVGLHLSKVILDHQDCQLFLGDLGNRSLASGSFPILAPPGELYLTDSFGRPAGVLVSESARLGIFQSWEVGVHTFQPQQSQFAASVCVPTPEVGVRGVLLDDGSLLTGDVWLVGEDGVVLREDNVSLAQGCNARDYSVVRVDVVGDPLFRRRLCTPAELFDTPRFIKKFKVISPTGTFTCEPDAHGNLTFFVNNHEALDTALRVRTTVDGIVLEMVGS